MQNNTFSTLFVGQNLIKLLAVDSTNSYLKKLTSNSEPLPEGTVILADCQYAGRGQAGNSWLTEANKNLTFSIYLKPVFIAPQHQFLINMMVSVALNNVLDGYFGNDAKIKWPNDLYVKSHKIGGVLIENAIAGKKIKSTIIGIGINVNQHYFHESLTDKATSFAKILHRDVSLSDLLKQICEAVEREYLKLQNGEIESLKSFYTAKLFGLNKMTKYKANGNVFDGELLGVSDEGLLRVKPFNENLVEFNFKEIEFLIFER